MGRLRVWQSRQPVLRRALERFSDDDLVRLMRRAAAVDRIVKGVDRLPVWEAVGGLVLEMLAPQRFCLPA
jgi:DNA polymerase III delta subunit